MPAAAPRLTDSAQRTATWSAREIDTDLVKEAVEQVSAKNDFAANVAVAKTADAMTGGTGTDAVAQGGTFDFVAPGGQTDIFYDPPSERGTLGELSGPDLMEEGKTTSLSDYQGQVVVLAFHGQMTEAPLGQYQACDRFARGHGFRRIGQRQCHLLVTRQLSQPLTHQRRIGFIQRR